MHTLNTGSLAPEKPGDIVPLEGQFVKIVELNEKDVTYQVPGEPMADIMPTDQFEALRVEAETIERMVNLLT